MLLEETLRREGLLVQRVAVEGLPTTPGQWRSYDCVILADVPKYALPDDQRMVIVMCDVQEMNYAEIAGAMRIALGTVKSRIARARAKLRECIQHQRELLPSAFRLEREQT
ncbi:MAG: sigma factor-like helix-turn-helix DNA-binding protein [Chloroflexota bacterium]